jgi:uncharacterized protein YecE (DUF72 family)
VSRSLFDDAEEPSPLVVRLTSRLRSLAERGVNFGTSSWKYEGWLGSIYTPEHYVTRGKFSRKKFDAECLREYATIFPVVGGDFSFYRFPSPDDWAAIFAGAPPTLAFGLKVPEYVTVARWPTHARYGVRAGQWNEGFLDARLFHHEFARLLEPYRNQVAVMIFEFGQFAKTEIADRGDFLSRLDAFLTALPPGWRYSIEIRNPEYLKDDYFELLSRHKVAHCFNAWTRMPTVAEQIALPGAFTANFSVVRALLQRGVKYETAVSSFQPYRDVQKPDESTRSALRQIAERALHSSEAALIFVNNRLEGHAPTTIDAIVGSGLGD